MLIISTSALVAVKMYYYPFTKTQLFAADRRTSHGSEKEETLRRPTKVPEETESITI